MKTPQTSSGSDWPEEGIRLQRQQSTKEAKSGTELFLSSVVPQTKEETAGVRFVTVLPKIYPAARVYTPIEGSHVAISSAESPHSHWERP